MKTDFPSPPRPVPDLWELRRAERMEQASAVRRAEAVLRILKDRSTMVDEAVRMNVDIETVASWLAITLAAIGSALDDRGSATGDTQASRMPRRQSLAS